jgi:hypothetical protein
MALDVDNSERICAWDSALMPIGNDTLEKEPFGSYWDRCCNRLSHLDPLIVEQWVYRHWSRSPYGYLRLDALTWRLEAWCTPRILRDIYLRPQFGDLTPETDFEFAKGLTGEPCKSLREIGTWNYPIVVMETPDGVIAHDEHKPDIRYCLIEGHQRVRFLAAWHGRALTAVRHELFILAETSVGSAQHNRRVD